MLQSIPNYMKCLKFIALIISILCIFCSCGSDRVYISPKRTKLMRTYDIHYAGSLTWYTDSVVRLREVDTLYRIGDIITTGNTNRMIIIN
jgi:hypothetical protein